jgi:single-stranded-DNA-specific exonuclease
MFVSREAEIIDARTVGGEGKHLKLKLKKDSAIFNAIAFGFGDLFQKITPGVKVDIVYSVEDNSWNNRKNLQLKIKDIR